MLAVAIFPKDGFPLIPTRDNMMQRPSKIDPPPPCHPQILACEHYAVNKYHNNTSDPEATEHGPPQTQGPIARSSRLGGLLNFYFRKAG